ncbi:acyl-CoA dehydrogenase [Klebsiella pneumoniae]|uniref:Acyl-CoA dehydrogenase n=1 Tax=Klebsiella pneumoniae TaxID=573 RepID=A0A377X911_KLEPN|nr:acyl-CoA dehydrogenase [Klebsiella pneumoniae]
MKSRILRFSPTGIAIHTDSAVDPVIVDLVAIATGHLWPEEERASRQYFPSPWTGLMEARIAPLPGGDPWDFIKRD